ncbi:hypothetical protein OS176_12315 [Xanthomonadaceae bacterium XH05]|nr:hypothetical protein [Xanthomonadaceae bacterium XH05]
MKRRHFMLCTSAASVAAAIPLTGTAATRRPALLDDPRAWLGSEFVSGDGTRLRLADVVGVRVDRYTMQADLRFELLEGKLPDEGSHTLHCDGSEETLFLQPGQHGPVACINRLRRTVV